LHQRREGGKVFGQFEVKKQFFLGIWPLKNYRRIAKYLEILLTKKEKRKKIPV
jgi:hypothetical protein